LVGNLDQKAAAGHWARIGVRKRFGVSVPLFSLRSEAGLGIGEVGDLWGMVDFCRGIGATVIQILPLNDMGTDRVPYASLSAFAMDPAFISLGRIDAVASSPDLSRMVQSAAQRLNASPRVDFDAVRSAKTKILTKALKRTDGPELRAEFDAFMAGNQWLKDYLAYRVIKEAEAFRPWEEWSDRWSDDRIAALPDTHRDLWDLNLYSQWLLDGQLREAAAYARENGVLLMGDVPILVARDSADVWRNPGYFRLDTCAGAPPDQYSDTGQTWGFPTYRWDALWADGNAWWKARLAHAQRYFDLYRIDHVVGFFRIWTLPDGAPDGRDGWFEPGDESRWGEHWRAILRMMLDATDMLPLAEDLGTIPPVCRHVLSDMGICGLKVQRWERYWDGDGSFIPPDRYDPVSLATFSTHDTEVLADWWRRECDDRQRLYRTLGHDGEAPATLEPWLHRDLVRWLSGAGSLFYVLAIQDILAPSGLAGDDPGAQRINLPGTVNATNWNWRCPTTIQRLLDDPDLAASIRAMITSDRLIGVRH